MAKELSEQNARALADLRQQERLHWSAMITTLMGFTAVVNVGIWSYFLSEYIKAGGGLPSYVLIGSAVSAITLGGWRLYSRYLDNQIAALYSELVLYEAKMAVPPGLGVAGYLIRNVPNVKPIFDSNLSEKKKSEAIAILSESKNLGSRGHFVIDLVTLCAVIIVFIVSLLSLWHADSFAEPIYIVCLIGIVGGLALVLIALCCYQRNPSPKLISTVLRKYTSDTEKNA